MTRWLPIVAALLLAACATPRAPQTAPPDAARTEAWIAHHATLSEVSGFRISGRVSSDAATGSARLSWTQEGERFSARAAGPFGSGAVGLSGTPQAVRIRSGDEQITTDRPELWMQQQLGWSLPVAGLRYWALGMPRPGTAASYRFDEAGRLAQLTQSGWRVVYSDYAQQDGVALPGRIHLHGPESAILLRVDAWQSLERDGTRG